MGSELYYKDNYLNKNISNLFNKVIIEYDLKSANTSLCKEYNLLPMDEISRIEDMNKKQRVVTIGKLMKKDTKFKDGIKESFVDIRRRFFESNGIEDSDILSIKKDAIFCLREVEHTSFGHCTFVKKNQYTSYMYVNKLEIYYNSSGKNIYDDGVIDVKGIDDIVLKKHNEYMISFLKVLFKHCETSSIQVRNRYINRFVTNYKLLKLDVGYYREFDNYSIFRMKESDETYDDEVFIPYENKQEQLDIQYNFFNIILPIITILL